MTRQTARQINAPQTSEVDLHPYRSATDVLMQVFGCRTLSDVQKPATGCNRRKKQASKRRSK